MRDPTDARMDWLAYSPIGREVEVVWLKDYYQFRNWILTAWIARRDLF